MLHTILLLQLPTIVKNITSPYSRHDTVFWVRGVPCLDFALRDAPRTKRSTVLRVERSLSLLNCVYFT